LHNTLKNHQKGFSPVKKLKTLLLILSVALLTAACSPAEFDVTSTDGWIEPAAIQGEQGEGPTNAEEEQDNADIINMDSRENINRVEMRDDEDTRQVEMAADENADMYTLVDGEPATRAYLTLTSDGAAATLTDISTDIADEVIIARSTAGGANTQGLDTLDSLTIVAGETLEMSPDDTFLFVIGLDENIDEGDIIEMTLTFENGETISATAESRNVN
jgi:copper(I)-binding protein